ncbi:MAG: SIS domain-containing protein [Chloroflexota bacterium]|nr:SIS domain-containing protein [Chloroflexota bacterium]
MTQKSEYYFIAELKEQPGAVAETVGTQWERIVGITKELPHDLSRVLMVGCGDPYFASEAAVYPFERWTRIPAEAVDALEFRFWRSDLVDERTLVILISQSGKTIQVVESARLARAQGAAVIGITNSPDSPLAEQSEYLVHTAGGPSYSFPTRTTTAAAAVLFALALALGAARGLVPEAVVEERLQLLREDLPLRMKQTLNLEEQMRTLAHSWRHHNHFAFIGSGPGYAAARVGAAKINETNRMQSEADELEEYGHLHLFALQQETPLVFLAPSARTAARVEAMVDFAAGRGTPVAVFGAPETQERWQRPGVHGYEMPDVDEIVSPLVYVIPLQLFAYHLALVHGRDPDRPEGFDNAAIQKMIYTGLLEGWHEEEVP